MPFRDISYLQLWQLACLAEQSYNLKAILLESIMRNISAKLFCICTSAEFRLSFQLVEILTLQVSLAEINSFIMILNSNMIFCTPILEYLKTISLPNSTLSLSQPVAARYKTQANVCELQLQNIPNNALAFFNLGIVRKVKTY